MRSTRSSVGQHRSTPGCAVAVSQNGKVIVNRAYGSADLERDVPITSSTIFDAGSVGSSSLRPLSCFSSKRESFRSPRTSANIFRSCPTTGHKITLDHLLTHTSGIRDWTGIRPLAGGDPDVLTLILRQRGLNFAPGEEWSYSNSGYVLLKEIVARTSGMSFSDFTQKRLFEPLGMKSTTYLLDMTDVVKNRALAYKKEKDRWKLDMYFGNDRGGGGLLSTAGDLLIWNDALTNGRLGAFVTEKLQEPATAEQRQEAQLCPRPARGALPPWRQARVAQRRGGRVQLTRGPSSGTRTLCCHHVQCRRRRPLGIRQPHLRLVSTPCSRRKLCRGQHSGRECRRRRRDGRRPERQGGTVLQRADRPAAAPGRSNNTLSIAGGGPLVALAADRFRNQRASLSFMSQAEFELQFLSADQFEIKTKEGATTRYRRGQPYTPTAADLQAFAGRYRSDEVGAFFDMAPGKDSLMGRANDAPGAGLEFRPVDRDTFQLAGVILRFRRDKAGKVVAVDYSNPVVRNIKFTRLSDRQGSPLPTHHFLDPDRGEG